MNFLRIYAIMLRHLYQCRHDMWRVINIFYWATIDIIMWGFTAAWMVKSQQAMPALLTAFLVAAVAWTLLMRVQYEFGIYALEEMWSHNTVNLFASPLQLREWVIATTFLSLFVSIVLALYAALLVWLLYGISFVSLGFIIAPLFVLLYLSGLWMGFLATGCLFYWGVRMQVFIFMASWALLPLSGVYYTMDLFPAWVQKIAYAMPMIYIFDSIRAITLHSKIPTEAFFYGLLLNIIYSIISIIFFACMFRLSKRIGLARLAD